MATSYFFKIVVEGLYYRPRESQETGTLGSWSDWIIVSDLLRLEY
jgi:hypothetical protein